MFPHLRTAVTLLLVTANVFAADDLPGPHPGDQLPPDELQQGADRFTLDLHGYGYQPQSPLATLLVVLAPGIPGAAAADTARTATALAARYPGTIRLVLFAADAGPTDRPPWRSARTGQASREEISWAADGLAQQTALNLTIASDDRGRDLWRALGRTDHLALLLDPYRRVLHRQETLATAADAAVMATACDSAIAADAANHRIADAQYRTDLDLRATVDSAALNQAEVACWGGDGRPLRDLIAAHPEIADAGGPPDKSAYITPSFLAWVLAHGNLALAEQLYRPGRDVDLHFDDGGCHFLTALSWAITNHQPGSVTWLLDHRADARLACPAYPAPIDIAAISGNIPSILAQLRAAGAADTIFTATAAGDLLAIRRILARNPARALLCDGADHNPLDVAIINGQTAAFTLLLHAATYPDAALATALTAALRLRHPDIARIILAARPDLVRLRRFRGCESNGDRPWLPYVNITEYTHDDAMLRRLIILGADLDGADSSGETPLFHAIDNDDLALANLLLDHGANPSGPGGPCLSDFRDPGRLSPLILAIDHHSVALVTTLLAHHARVDGPAAHDRPLQYLIENWDADHATDDIRIARLLLAANPSCGFFFPTYNGLPVARYPYSDVPTDVTDNGTYLGHALQTNPDLAHLLYDAGARLGADEVPVDPLPAWLRIPPLDPDHPPITNRAPDGDPHGK
jgi:hypothetical protein